MKLKLTDTEVATTVSVGGVDAWSHIAWANKVIQLAKDAGIDAGNSLIWMVRDNLPDVLKDQVGSEFKDWKEFVRKVRGVDVQNGEPGRCGGGKRIRADVKEGGITAQECNYQDNTVHHTTHLKASCQ